MANPVTGTFTATGQSPTFVPETAFSSGSSDFNASLWGTFSGSVQLERSFDGTVWLPLTAAGSVYGVFTAPVSEILSEPEAGVMYRLNCTAFTSGTINYRLSQ